MREPAKADICYARRTARTASRSLARRCRTVLVVGAPASSNANRLVEVARAHGAASVPHRVGRDIQPAWVTGDIGITAGASTPERICRSASKRVRSLGDYRLEEFRLVRGARHVPAARRAAGGAQEKGIAVGAGNERAAERASAEFRVRHH